MYVPMRSNYLDEWEYLLDKREELLISANCILTTCSDIS